MSSTPQSVEEYRQAQSGETDETPDSRVAARARDERVLRRTRVELGIFVRKIVDGRVVRQWQFPPKRRAEAEQAPVREMRASGAERAAAQEPPAPPAPPPQMLAAQAPATDDGGSSSDEKTTTYEAGFFFRTESVSPPEWGGSEGTEPPDDA
ncbi:MAG: hypothetical protein PVG07_02365 [Acidobacteriota bacterium]|jgi:hypothetical protein